MIDRLDQFSTIYLHQRLDYNPITGIFLWNRIPVTEFRHKTWNARFADKQAGNLDNRHGYILIGLGGGKLLGHRLAWKMTYGETPPPGFDIDHCDRVRHHNSISNLRLATETQTTQNRSLASNNTSGVRGVHFDAQRGKWRARIMVNGKKRTSTYFLHIEDAIAFRHRTELEGFGEFSPLSDP